MIEPSGQAGLAKRRLGMLIMEILVTQDKGTGERKHMVKAVIFDMDGGDHRQ